MTTSHTDPAQLIAWHAARARRGETADPLRDRIAALIREAEGPFCDYRVPTHQLRAALAEAEDGFAAGGGAQLDGDGEAGDRGEA